MIMNEEVEELKCQLEEYKRENIRLKTILDESYTVFIILEPETGKIMSVERSREIAIEKIKGKGLYLMCCKVN